jgi:hypothetical protein
MKGRNEKNKYVPRFLKKTRPNAAVAVKNYFRESKKSHLNTKAWNKISHAYFPVLKENFFLKFSSTISAAHCGS